MISFVTVNYRLPRDILALAEDLSKVGFKNPIELIVVDNSASEETFPVQFLQRLSFARYVPAEQNLGFGRACNLGVEHAKGDIIVLINPDMRIEAGSEIESYIEAGFAKDTGILSPGLAYPDGREQPSAMLTHSNAWTFVAQSLALGRLYNRWRSLHSIAKIVLSILPASNTFREYMERRNVNQRRIDDCAWVSGSCLIVPREIYDAVGGFDPAFFMYTEDEDFCRRVRTLGARIRYDPALRLVHQVSGSRARLTRREKDAQQMRRFLGNIYYLRKFGDHRGVLLLKLWYSAFYALRSLSSLHSLTALKCNLASMGAVLNGRLPTYSLSPAHQAEMLRGRLDR